MTNIKIENRQIVTVELKTHKVIFASKKDLGNVNEKINEFFNDLELIKVIENVIPPAFKKPVFGVNESIIKPKKSSEKRNAVISLWNEHMEKVLSEEFDVKNTPKS